MRNAVIAPFTRGDHAPVKREDMAQLMAIKGHLFRARCGPLGLEMHPIYRVEKRPRLRDRQGQYAVIGMDGRILKRGNDLRAVLRVLERKLIRAVET